MATLPHCCAARIVRRARRGRNWAASRVLACGMIDQSRRHMFDPCRGTGITVKLSGQRIEIAVKLPGQRIATAVKLSGPG
jgi:hypothetical protein